MHYPNIALKSLKKRHKSVNKAFPAIEKKICIPNSEEQFSRENAGKLN